MSTIELAIGHLREPRAARRAESRPKGPPRAPVLPLPASPIKTRILCDYGPDDHVEPRPRAPVAHAPRPSLAIASVLSALLGALVMYATMHLANRASAPPSAASAEMRIEAPAVVAAAVAPVPSLPVASADPSPATPAPSAPRAAAVGAQDLEDAERAIFAWAAAWSGRDAEQYLAAYSAAFTPDKGLTRAAWESARRKRLAGARSIGVTLRNLQVEPVAGERIIARFAQDYAADNYRERGTPKMLVLVREGGAWRIAAEVEDAHAATAG